MNTQMLKDAWTAIYNNLIPIILGLSIFIEIAPIKFNPISSFIELLFKPVKKDIEQLKSDMDAKIDTISKNNNDRYNEVLEEIKVQYTQLHADQTKLEKEQKSYEMHDIKQTIGDFADSIDNAQLHSIERYRSIIQDYKKYKQLAGDDAEQSVIDDGDKITKFYEKYKDTGQRYF